MKLRQIKEVFVELMNLQAKSLGMSNTFFANPTGLDPADDGDPINYSSVTDLTKLAYHLTKEPLILQMTAQREFDLYSIDGKLQQTAATTNELLNSDFSFGGKMILGGKTGETKKAGQTLILIFKDFKTNGYLVNVILGSEDRFADMMKMINWVFSAYEI